LNNPASHNAQHRLARREFLGTLAAGLTATSLATVLAACGGAAGPSASSPAGSAPALASPSGAAPSPASPSGAASPAAASKPSTSAVAGEPIKLGLLLTNVGPRALFARPEDKGARLLIDQTNKSGGINGRQIELVPYDTEGKPDRAATLYRRLANDDKVAAVIGPDSILVVLGMAGVPHEVQTLSVSAPGTYNLIKPEFRDYMVTAWSTGGLAGTLILAYFNQKLNIKRIGVMTTADVIGKNVETEVGSLGKIFGTELVKAVAQPSTDTDLLPSLRELASVKPPIEGMIVFGSGPFGNIAINQTELAGLKVPIGYLGGNVVPQLIKDVGPAASRVFLVSTRLAVLPTLPAGDPFAATLKQFDQDYQAAYHEPVSMPSGVGYDMALPIVEAIKAVGTDRKKIRDAVWETQDLTGRQGVKFHRRPGDGVGVDVTDTVIATIKDGQFAFVDYMNKVTIDKAAVTALMREETWLT